MNRLQKTILSRVFGAHMGVLFLLLFIPWIKGCIHPKPKVIMIDLASMPPPPEPEPMIEPEPPAPQPKPKPTPLPPKTNAPPKKVETKKPEPKKAEQKKETPKKTEQKPPAPKPKTLEERLAEVRKGGKTVKPSPAVRPQIDLTGLKSALNSAAAGTGSGSGSGTVGSDPNGWYYDRITQQMYSVWQQPSGAPEGLTAVVRIGYRNDGTVLSKTITVRSGNAQFDQSVQSALNMTSRLPSPIPTGIPNPIEITFVLSR